MSVIPADPLGRRARDLPAIRDVLVDRWRPGGVFTEAERQRAAEYGHPTWGPAWDARTLPTAELVWVSADLTDLVVSADTAVPDDLDHAAAVPPFLSAFVVFDRSVYGTSADGAQESMLGDGTVRVEGVLWGPVELGPEPGDRGWGIASYCRTHPDLDGVWLPLGRSDWLTNERCGDVLIDNDDAVLASRSKPAYVESAIEDRRLLAALWAVMRMERVVDTSTWTPRSKQARRRHAGRGPEVRVLHLRRTSAPAGEPDLPADSPYRHRWWVSPHWRWQRVGPGRAERRLTLVSAHVKGPEGAPFVNRQRVWAVDR